MKLTERRLSGSETKKICSENYEMILGYLMALTGGDTWLAEDLTQETFLRAIRGFRKFRGDAKISTWLCQIAKFTFYQYLAKKKRYREVSYDELGEISTDIWPEIVYLEREETDHLYRAIAELDGQMREVILLRIRGDLSFAEIGRLLDRTENWARVNFYRGKQKLAEKLAGNPEMDPKDSREQCEEEDKTDGKRRV